MRLLKSSGQKARDGEALPRRASPTVVEVSRRLKASTVKPPCVKAVRWVDRRDGRLKFEVDHVTVEDPRDEVQLHAEGLVFDRDGPFSWLTGTRVTRPAREEPRLPDPERAVRLGSARVRTNATAFEGLEQDADFPDRPR